ncbi:MAG: hypothetical protein QOG53_3628 [Frankiales bacterium]|jgi:hypothetical protein|nr:hypothetical protein [Frankiales bacterium]
MELTLRFTFDDPTAKRQRTFTLDVDRPYPGIPRVGEAVVPDKAGQLAPRRVSRVVYNPDGTLILDLDLDAPADNPEAQVMALETVGFEEQDPIKLL